MDVEMEEESENDMLDPKQRENLNTDNDLLEWMRYDVGSTEEPFEHWLMSNLPSAVEKKNGFGWISVYREVGEEEEDEDFEGLQQSWEQLLASDRPLNYQNIKQLAMNHNYRTGKWMIFADSGGKIDHLWSLVATAIAHHTLPCFFAKVSTHHEGKSHVLCIYNKDFSNHDDVMSSEKAIRDMGIKCRLVYKPNVYTALGIYGGNQWHLSPIILTSNYDILKGNSIVEFLPGIN